MCSRQEPLCAHSAILVLALFAAAALPLPAQQPAFTLPDNPLRLADCLAISEERQPSLVVARARLAVAQSRLASLESLDGPLTRLRHDLPIRRQQARLGIDTAQADLARLEIENRYVVTRAYFTVLYARAQRKVLDDVLDDLMYLRERVQKSVTNKERPEWSAATVDLITLYLRRVEARRAEADRGIVLGLAAVREALNLEPTVCLKIADETLPRPAIRVCREDILAAAVARRSEIIEASLASEATVLETEAQAARCRSGAFNTFAAATDLHAKHVPQPIYGETFRPGGIPLYMPSVLVGPRAGRVETAQDLSIQAAAVVRKTRNLVILEAEEAYAGWEEWSKKVVALGEADRVGLRLGRELRKEYHGTIKRLIEALLPETLLAAQSRTDYNEALFQKVIALAALERVTAGAFCAGLANAATPVALPAPEKP